MAITAQNVIHRVATTLQDLTAVRWTTDELVRYLNDGQRELVMFRPDASNTSATFTCVAGPRQTLPADGIKLLDVVRNVATASNKGHVNMIQRSLLDVQVPNWYAKDESVNIAHYMYDGREPTAFYVYPPATNTAQLEINYSTYPAAISEPGASTTYTSVTGNVDLPDIYANALVDYVLYRAYSKDSEQAGNAQRAAAHYAAFGNALNIEVQGTTGVAPTK